MRFARPLSYFDDALKIFLRVFLPMHLVPVSHARALDSEMCVRFEKTFGLSPALHAIFGSVCR
jgi:hypothetical protein